MVQEHIFKKLTNSIPRVKQHHQPQELSLYTSSHTNYPQNLAFVKH